MVRYKQLFPLGVLLIALLHVSPQIFAEQKQQKENPIKKNNASKRLEVIFENKLKENFKANAKKMQAIRRYICASHKTSKKKKNMSVYHFNLARFGQGYDFFQRNWKKCESGIRVSLFSLQNSQIQKAMIQLFLENNPADGHSLFVDMLKKYKQGRKINPEVIALLRLAEKQSRRNFFARKIFRDPKILQEMTAEKFFYYNGRRYPTAIQILGYKALGPLMQGLLNKDKQVRLYMIKGLYYIKTQYNKKRVIRQIDSVMRRDNILQERLVFLRKYYRK